MGPPPSISRVLSILQIATLSPSHGGSPSRLPGTTTLLSVVLNLIAPGTYLTYVGSSNMCPLVTGLFPLASGPQCSSRTLWFCVRIPFLFKGERYSVVWIDHILFIHLPINGHLGGFHLFGHFGHCESCCCEHGCMTIVEF